MSFTVNGRRLLTAVITEATRGAWVADVEVEASGELPSTVTIDFGTAAARFVGTVVRGGVHRDRWIARIVGGAGKLSIDVESRYYDAVPVKTVLAGLMEDSGEASDGTILPALLSSSLPKWLRPAGAPQDALDDLANELGVTWRVTRAGKVWLGQEKWPELSIPHVEMSPGPAAGTLSVAPAEAPLVRPGATFLGKRISYVVTTLQGGKLRQELWVEEGGGNGSGRLLEVLAALVRRLLGRRLTYLGTYPSTVVGQTSDGLSLEVVPDHPEVRGEGLQRVPIRHGSPGWGVRVPNGTRVSLAFDGGDPSKPYVAGWQPGAVDQITVTGGTQDVARMGDMVQNGGPTTLLQFVAPPGAPPNNAVVVGVPYQILWVQNGVPGDYLSGVISSGNSRFKA